MPARPRPPSKAEPTPAREKKRFVELRQHEIQLPRFRSRRTSQVNERPQTTDFSEWGISKNVENFPVYYTPSRLNTTDSDNILRVMWRRERHTSSLLEFLSRARTRCATLHTLLEEDNHNCSFPSVCINALD